MNVIYPNITYYMCPDLAPTLYNFIGFSDDDKLN